MNNINLYLYFCNFILCQKVINVKIIKLILFKSEKIKFEIILIG